MQPLLRPGIEDDDHAVVLVLVEDFRNQNSALSGGTAFFLICKDSHGHNLRLSVHLTFRHAFMCSRRGMVCLPGPV